MFASQAEHNDPLILKKARQLHRAAWWSLVVSRLRLSVLTFPRVYPKLGHLMAESPHTDPEGCEGLVEGIALAIDRMRWYLPWQSNCLVRAVAAHRMLSRRGIPHTLYIGMAKSVDGAFEVHAWLRCGSRVVTGGGQLERYAVVAHIANAGQPLVGQSDAAREAGTLQGIALADFRT